MWREISDNTDDLRSDRREAEENINRRSCRGCRPRPEPDPEPELPIAEVLDDIVDSLHNIEECTCDRIVRLLRRILDAIENDNHHRPC